jgi:hypothetical protein
MNQNFKYTQPKNGKYDHNVGVLHRSRFVNRTSRLYNVNHEVQSWGGLFVLEWTYRNYSFEADLQLIHADVRIAWNGEVWVEETLCIDVGLPALLNSLRSDTAPNRFADPVGSWREMPFLVCGCGDPDCRALSFAVTHLPGGRIRLTQLEERPGREPRELVAAELSLAEWRGVVLPIARDYLDFVAGLPYRPLLAEAAALVRKAYDDGMAGDAS